MAAQDKKKKKLAKKTSKENGTKANVSNEVSKAHNQKGSISHKNASNHKSSNNQNKNKKKTQKVEKSPMTMINNMKIYASRIFSKQMASNLVFNPAYFWVAACLFMIAEAVLNVVIIEKVNYTEIDWKAYMQEVEGFLNGTWDYTSLKGDTGPLVYPAGFVYVFSGLYYLTDKGTNIRIAQYIFAVVYLLTLALVFRIYHKTKKVPPYIVVFLCCTSYRIHSIFVLRLFNDPFAMLFLYAAINLFISNYWTWGSILYSFAVSIKMNVLLFSPALLMIFFYVQGILGTLKQLFVCAAVQVILAAPFLTINPMGYLKQAFDVSRIFLYEWTVNWRFLDEEIFVDKRFHIGLMAAQVLFLIIFAFLQWRRYLTSYNTLKPGNIGVTCQLLVLPLFVSNFIGIMFSRSLHYQFYVWYFHTIPYLLWSIDLSAVFRLLLLGVLELCWNQFPSTVWSSALMLACHIFMLGGLLYNTPTDKKLGAMRKKNKKE